MGCSLGVLSSVAQMPGPTGQGQIDRALNVERAYREFRDGAPDGPWDKPAIFDSMYRPGQRPTHARRVLGNFLMAPNWRPILDPSPSGLMAVRSAVQRTCNQSLPFVARNGHCGSPSGLMRKGP
jgi:hypothetical protein